MDKIINNCRYRPVDSVVDKKNFYQKKEVYHLLTFKEYYFKGPKSKLEKYTYPLDSFYNI